MRIRSERLFRLGAFLGSTLARRWMNTLDYRAVFYTPRVDPALSACLGPKIYVFWHEYILFPIFHQSHSAVAVLLSRHRDADILSYFASHLRFHVVRGSTKRGGAGAVRELFRTRGRMHLVITPDGPRGPRRRMALGPIYMASKLGLPLVTLGFGCDRPWRITGAWDRFAVPRPYSRVRAVVSPEIAVPEGLDREGLEHFRRQTETLLNRLCDEAEQWAESGAPREGQVSVAFRSDYRIRRRFDRAHPMAPTEP